MKCCLLGILVGAGLAAVCWQLSAWLCAQPGDVVGIGVVLLLAGLSLGWLALMAIALYVMQWRDRQAQPSRDDAA